MMGEEESSGADTHVCYEEDDGGDPLVAVINSTYKRKRVVDVIKSLERNPSNIGHPLIVSTIVECAGAVVWRRERRTPFRLDQVTGERWLKRISPAALSDARERRKEVDKLRAAFQTLVDVDDDYFGVLATLLEDPSIKDLPAGRKVELISERINAAYPGNKRNREVTTFLNEIFFPSSLFRNDPIEVPERGGGSSLRNQFIRWRTRLDLGSAKNLISKARADMRGAVAGFPPDYPLDPVWGIFTEAEVDAAAEAAALCTLGMGVVDPAVEENLPASGLVFVEVFLMGEP